MKKTINVKRLEIRVIEKKLDNMPGTNKQAKAFLTMLTLNQPSPKHKMAANAPFPAVVKEAENGRLAVFNCTSAKQEIIPSCSFRQPSPITSGQFEYKGHIYEKNPVHDLYTLKK